VAEGKGGELPETVLAMVETRLARLSIEARRVLRAASVFGEVCWESSVLVLVGGAMGATMAGEWVGRLVEQEMLTVRPDSRFPRERELAFRHALLREGAYATFTDDDKRLGHRLAGEWLEQHGEADPMVLAAHFERGGDGERAARYYLRAAEQAFHILDIQATIARVGLGLACDPPPVLRQGLLGLRCELTAQHLQLVSVNMPVAEELMRTAPRGSVLWSQAMLAYVEGSMVTGRIPDLLAAIGQLGDVEPAPDALGKMALILLNGVCILDSIGQIPEGSTLEERFAAVIRTAGEREPIARFWWHIARALRQTYAYDDPWDALAHSDAIRPIFEATGGERIFLNMELFRGLNYWFLGAFETAERILAAIVTADEALGVASSLRRFGLTWVLADRGALDDARALAAQLADYGAAHHFPLEEGRGRWALAEVLRRRGELPAAERELRAGLGMLVPLEQPGALATLSAIQLAAGRAADALATSEDALGRVTAMGGCGMYRGAFVRLAHAEALYATGAIEAAGRAIAGARAHLLATADRIPDPACRRSFLESVPENARTFALAGAWLGEAAPAPVPVS
jgi:hypothetical protein